MYKALHPRDDVDRLFVSRKERGRGLTIIEGCIEEYIQPHEGNIERHDGGLNTVIRNDTDITMDNNLEKNNSVGGLND